MLGSSKRAITRALLKRLSAGLEGSSIRLTAGSESAGPSESAARYTMVFQDLRSIFALACNPHMAFGDLYTAGTLRVIGDLPGLICEVLRKDQKRGLARPLVPRVLFERSLRNDLGSARKSARHHYDIGNDFYQVWLDERMVYTCAYFDNPEASLEEAQIAKMDHVCRKLALQPGQHVIEAGCGWGSLALHMARYYDVTVRAYNISAAQISYAQEQAEKENLTHRIEFVRDDYRNATGDYDVFVSIGMLEHVGIAHYPDLGRVINRTLRPEGIGLIHTIGRNRPIRLNPWIERRVFPNAHPPTIGEMMGLFEPAGLVVLDIENLRRHYALTARCWYDRYLKNKRRLSELVPPETLRTWELYLAGTTASFEASTLELFQALFTRVGNDCIPWTRRSVYSNQHTRIEGAIN